MTERAGFCSILACPKESFTTVEPNEMERDRHRSIMLLNMHDSVILINYLDKANEMR